MIASTSPAASIGSRTGKPTFSIFTLAVSMPVTLAKIGHCAEITSAAGAASFFPSRSFGVAMPRLLRAMMAEGACQR
jgi:hypothetical protein